MRILSFDCGNVSLGYAVVDYNVNWSQESQNIINQIQQLIDKLFILVNELNILVNELNSLTNELYPLINELNELTNLLLNTVCCFKLVKTETVNVISGYKFNKTSPGYRCTQLFNLVQSINQEFPFNTLNKVIIEDQMSPNEKSRGVFYNLMFYYNTLAYNIKPTWKNRISYPGRDLKLYKIKYSKNYDANKVHCRENFLYYLTISNQLNKVEKYTKKALYNDKADAFMQAMAYIIFDLQSFKDPRYEI